MLQISTKRLLIRNLKTEDLQDFYTYRSNREVTMYQGFDVMSLEQAENFIIDQINKPFGIPGQWVQYGIIETQSNKLIGDCAIKLEKDEPRIAEIGMTLNPLYQKKGFAKEALKGLMAWLFETKNIHRISEIVDVENLSSVSLLESVGFRKEATFVENIFFNGKWGSEFQYAMLQREWNEIKKTF